MKAAPALRRQCAEASCGSFFRTGRTQAAGPLRTPEQRNHERDIVMVEANTASTASKPKPKAVGFNPEESKFEIPRFDIPKFELPKLEMPAAFREFAEKGVTQAKDNWEKMKAATEEATDLIEGSYAAASKGMLDYSLKLIDAARANTNAAFDLAAELIAVKSASEAVELSTAHARKQFEAMSVQTKELASLAQKVASETAEPIRESVASAFKKVA
jgi:phasin